MLIFTAMLFGWATPTEAGALGAFSTLVFAWRHGMTWPQFRDAMLESAKLTVMIFTIIWGVLIFVRFLGYASTEDFDETRWIDRLVSEVNIIETWQQLLAKYLFFMPKTFRDIDPATLERRDAPAGFRVFREAAMNGTKALEKHFQATKPPGVFWSRNGASLKAAAAAADGKQ